MDTSIFWNFLENWTSVSITLFLNFNTEIYHMRKIKNTITDFILYFVPFYILWQTFYNLENKRGFPLYLFNLFVRNFKENRINYKSDLEISLIWSSLLGSEIKSLNVENKKI